MLHFKGHSLNSSAFIFDFSLIFPSFLGAEEKNQSFHSFLCLCSVHICLLEPLASIWTKTVHLLFWHILSHECAAVCQVSFKSKTSSVLAIGVCLHLSIFHSAFIYWAVLLHRALKAGLEQYRNTTFLPMLHLLIPSFPSSQASFSQRSSQDYISHHEFV